MYLLPGFFWRLFETKLILKKKFDLLYALTLRCHVISDSTQRVLNLELNAIFIDPLCATSFKYQHILKFLLLNVKNDAWKRKFRPNLMHTNFIAFQYGRNKDAIKIPNTIIRIENSRFTNNTIKNTHWRKN